MKKLLAILLSLMLALSITACGGEEETAEVAEAVEEDVVKEAVEEAIEEEVVEEEVVEEEVVEEEVVEEEATEYTGGLFDLPLAETPDLPGTTWSLAGAMIDGVELETEQLENEVLPLYGGQLDFAFHEDGAQIVQGNGTLDGECTYMDEGALVLIEHEGEILQYACVFTEIEGTVVMIALTDETGINGLYFVQN